MDIQAGFSNEENEKLIKRTINKNNSWCLDSNNKKSSLPLTYNLVSGTKYIISLNPYLVEKFKQFTHNKSTNVLFINQDKNIKQLKYPYSIINHSLVFKDKQRELNMLINRIREKDLSNKTYYKKLVNIISNAKNNIFQNINLASISRIFSCCFKKMHKIMQIESTKNILLTCKKSHNKCQHFCNSNWKNKPKSIIVSGSRDCSIKIWSIKSKKYIKTLTGHYDSVNTLAKLSNKIVISGSSDNTLRIWDVQLGVCIKSLDSDYQFRKIINLSRKDIISFNGDNSIRVWDILKGECCNFMDNFYFSFLLIKIDYNSVAFANKYCEIVMMKYENLKWKRVKALNGHTDTIYSMVKLSNTTVASGSLDLTIKIWNIISGECIKSLNVDIKYIYRLVKLNSNTIIMGTKIDDLKLLNTNSLSIKRSYLRSYLKSTLVVVNNNTIICSDEYYKIKVKNIESNERMKFLGHNSFINTVLVLS